MKKKYKIAGALLLTAAILFAVWRRFSVRMFWDAEDPSAVIIGGADGPTSIFIAGKMGSWTEFAQHSAVVLLVGAVLLAGIIFVGRRKK